jgi:hypothetical protein
MAETSAAQNQAPMAEVEAFLATYSPNVRAIALKLRDLVFEAAPGAIEQVDIPGITAASLASFGEGQQRPVGRCNQCRDPISVVAALT